MAIKHATNQSFDGLVQHGVTLVDFWAPWCGPCRMISPVLDEIDGELGSKASIVKVDVDQQGELASRYGVMSIPALFVLKDGEIVDKMVGFQSKEVLMQLVEKNL